MSLFFITGNAGKFAEIKAMLPQIEQIKIDLDELQEIDPHRIIAHKLQQAFQHQQGEFIVEDTSLYFEGLNGLPGPLVKWFLQTLKATGLAELASKLGNTKATAKTIIGYAKSAQDIHYFEGSVSGQIVAPRGDQGFGWDSTFQPDGSMKTFAEMTRTEKEEFSMRKLAVVEMQKFLAQ
jgi:inosine triphosphate pyrophosphatase